MSFQLRASSLTLDIWSSIRSSTKEGSLSAFSRLGTIVNISLLLVSTREQKAHTTQSPGDQTRTNNSPWRLRDTVAAHGVDGEWKWCGLGIDRDLGIELGFLVVVTGVPRCSGLAVVICDSGGGLAVRRWFGGGLFVIAVVVICDSGGGLVVVTCDCGRDFRGRGFRENTQDLEQVVWRW
ncbi:65-kda microtubule-associated protein 3 [Phtheirospermum japonicum]|uniref:65-kDa microtubule-associated protein 3 n=1 Tax=Phtheirospermum japonicum TaxID=374723 RepID=A0A830BW30_9LAMI|nr:65-kda microtubule-associated protein 3 [Phtheirospermum japonicum]